MKTIKILCRQNGENSTTRRDPNCEMLSVEGNVAMTPAGPVDLTEKTTCCYSYDDDRLCEVNLWEVREVQVPDWMTGEQYCRNYVEWRYYVGFGADPEWPQRWFARISPFKEAEKLALIKLLKIKKFRSSFRESLRKQLESWLADADPKYNTPFSPKQWNALVDVYTARDARRIGESIYRNR